MKPLPCFLRRERIVVALDAHHVSHTAFARSVRLSRSHWSQLLNGHRPVTARVRRVLLRHPCLRGIPEEELWERVEPAVSGRRRVSAPMDDVTADG